MCAHKMMLSTLLAGSDRLSCPGLRARVICPWCRTMIEVDALPEDWVSLCNRMDAIWVGIDGHG